LRIGDILDAIARIEQYVSGLAFEQFTADQKTVDAVVRNLEIIGEAVRHLSTDADSLPVSCPLGRHRGHAKRLDSRVLRRGPADHLANSEERSAGLARGTRAARITTGDVTVHTLRHTALSRMIEHGLDDYTVMSISGHSSTRMLERHPHPPVERTRAAWRRSIRLATNWPQKLSSDAVQQKEAAEAASFLRDSGGRQEARTPDLRVANAALSQLS